MLKDYIVGIQVIRKCLDDLEQSLEENNLQMSATYYIQFMSLSSMFNALLGKSFDTTFSEKDDTTFPEIINDE